MRTKRIKTGVWYETNTPRKKLNRKLALIKLQQLKEDNLQMAMQANKVKDHHRAASYLDHADAIDGVIWHFKKDFK